MGCSLLGLLPQCHLLLFIIYCHHQYYWQKLCYTNQCLNPQLCCPFLTKNHQPKKSSCSGQCIHRCPCRPQWPTHFNKCLYLLLSLAVVAVIASDHHHGDVNTCHCSVCTHMAAVQEISYFVLGSHWACGAVPGMEHVASCLQDRPSTTEPSWVT